MYMYVQAGAWEQASNSVVEERQKKEDRERALGQPLAPNGREKKLSQLLFPAAPLAPNGREKKLCSAPFPSRPPSALPRLPPRDPLAYETQNTGTQTQSCQNSVLPG